MSAYVRSPEAHGVSSHKGPGARSTRDTNLLQQYQNEQLDAPVPVRTAIAEQAKANFIKASGRFGYGVPPTSALPLSPNPLRRTLTAPTYPSDHKQGSGLWEESTIGSMLDGSQDRAQGSGAKTASNGIVRPNYHDHPAFRTEQNPVLGGDDTLHPFTFGPDGRFTFVQDNHPALAQNAQAAIKSGGLLDSAPIILPPALQPPQRTLARSKLPLRDRETSRASYAERTVAGFPPDFKDNSAGPSKMPESATVPFDDGATKALSNQRSTLFQLSDDDDMIDADDSVADDETQRTPRPVRSSQQPQQRSKGLSRSPPKFNLGIGLQESSLPRHPHTATSGRTRKRKLSLDYDEAELKSMSFSQLRNEAFDYDPALGESPQRSNRNGASLQDRLEHYMHKDEKSQRDLFGTMNVNDWETAGDWFLEQFQEVINRLRVARKDKRNICRQFEEQLAARTEQIEHKAHAIDETLEKLRNDGEDMMRNKGID